MAKTGFTVSSSDGLGADLGDLLVPRDVFSEGGLWSWGDNTIGQLGDNTIVKKSSPVQTIAGGTNWKQVACGYKHTGAIKTDGTLWAWGYNIGGQLGDNSNVTKISPVQTIAGGTNWKQVACGHQHTVAIKTDGTLWSCGYNDRGQLFTSIGANVSSITQAVGTNWKQVAAGFKHTAAIKTDGTLWMCGYNVYGQLGNNGSVASNHIPVQTAAGGTNWKQVSCGRCHTAAIKTDGTLWIWGDNYYGQLGDNSRVNKSIPVQTIAGGTNWKQVACSGKSAFRYGHTAAIKTDGTLWTWGFNILGQLGDNTLNHKSSPVQTVAGGTNWKQVAVGESHISAIKTDGTLWSWGYNIIGQLGDNTIVTKSSPVQTIAGGTNWKQVACGNTHTMAVKDDI